MAWSPFSFDGFDDVNLPNITTDNTIDNGIVTAETLADDDSGIELFKSYQLTKEGANPFNESDEILDDDIEECGSKCKKESDEEFDDEDDMGESVFFSFGEHCGHCEEDDDDIEECGYKCKKESDEDFDDEDEISPFEEADLIMLDINEAVLNDGEDDLIADDIDDMTDEDDEEIDADAEGIDEIEEDIIDDEEDDLIDMAMEAEE